MANHYRPLNQPWYFTQLNSPAGDRVVPDGDWLKCHHFPTTVHVELLKEQKIPDPFLALHEWDVQWIGETDWAFKSQIDVTEEELKAPFADLVFEGLDTYAKVELNGHAILEANNQFVTWRVDAKKHLKAGQNDIVITFPSTFVKGRELEKKHGKLNLWNGDSSRLHVRKAQYNYGWDWGPVLMTVGPWRPIYLHTYSTRLSDVRLTTSLDTKGTGTLVVELELSGKAHSATAHVEVLGSGIKPAKVVIKDGKGRVEIDIQKGDVELWYPVGYGKQKLYEVKVELEEDGKALDSKTLKYGFRTIRVVQDPLVDQEGLTFLFEVNGIRIFCGGSNWIPADSFLTTMTPERYRAWLELLVRGNQNMIRIWGGGIYEPDVFYDICDELGILVWQDFMFGCGQYPAYDDFLNSVTVEAEQAVIRLRHHASLAIFTGNNEDYQIAESFKLDLDYSDEESDFRKTNFPARYIYERTLPGVVTALSDVYYHRSSPYSGQGKPTTDKTLGDLHQWNVWHGTQEPWHNWDILAGRFVSEFGMQGYPDIRTVDYWIGEDKKERFTQSRVMNNHNKADGFERRLELYLMENFKHAFDVESYVYYTQIMQAETLASAYRLWRRNWKGKGREYTAGALVWQINDCWPCTSWAIADYFVRPKPAFFAIARELRPYTVGMTRKEVKTPGSDVSAAFFSIATVLEIWGTNSTLEEKKATLDVQVFELGTGWTDGWKKDVALAPNASTELFKGDLPGQPIRKKLSERPRTLIVSARLLDNDGAVLGRYSNWPEPFKFIHFPSVQEVGLDIKPGSDGESVELSVKQPIKGVVLDVEGNPVEWSDQALDLFPGDTQLVKAKGLAGRKILARYLGDGSA